MFHGWGQRHSDFGPNYRPIWQRWCGGAVGFLDDASQLDKQFLDGSIFSPMFVFGGVMVCAISSSDPYISFSTGRLSVRMLLDTLQFLQKQFSVQWLGKREACLAASRHQTKGHLLMVRLLLCVSVGPWLSEVMYPLSLTWRARWQAAGSDGLTWNLEIFQDWFASPMCFGWTSCHGHARKDARDSRVCERFKFV